MEIFAKRLRERAAELGIAHAEAARRSGLDERRYSHYVSGIREPDLATLVQIARTLQTTPNYLLGVEDKKKLNPKFLIVDRLNSAAQALSENELEIIAIQAEALAGRARKTRKPKKL